MRKIILATFLLSSGTVQSADGNFIYELCSAGNDNEIVAYIAGWVDKRGDDVINFNRAAEAPGAPNVQPMRFLKNAIGGNICFPANVNAQQLKDVLCQHLNNNPQHRHLSGATLIWDAFNKAWPCKKS
ncbi:hypothetical protein GR238_36785 [Rhizobium leguminosarum]|uniref:Rap1a/Tai family immunity protein n=1 Tax=Rhizobium ruizarguesonis TaxID=2081791 RepID=UPI0013BE4CBB|nr:Rap1a/Tai family immunity protein [Rhizobium ruizarguesonis]NEJ10878.1 hypothetical protein [Rhizobium ruizarguesonis]